MALPNIIRYFRDCYEEDNRRSTLWNIFHGSVSHRLFVEREEELLTGFLTETPLDPDDGLDARKAAYLYQKEKELVYCSLFIVGRISGGEEEPRSICAPLLIHSAEIIEQTPHAFLKPHFENRRLNYHLLDALEGGSSQKSLSRQAAELLNDGPIAAEQVFELSALLEEAVPELNASALRQYPKLASQRDLRNMYSEVKEQGGRKQYLKDLKQYLDQLLAGLHTGARDQSDNPAQLEKELKGLDRELERLERRMRRRNSQELTWGRALGSQRTGVLQRIVNASTIE